jgi:hypothetical protein
VNGIILGGVLSVFWFMIGNWVLLSGDNIFRKILIKFGISNNLSEDVFLTHQDNELMQKFMRLKEQSEEVANIRKNLSHFRQSLENTEIVKKAKADAAKAKKTE